MEWVFQYLEDATIGLVALAVCATIAFMALWMLVAQLLRNRFGARSVACVWNKDPIQPEGDLVRWVCASCGATSFGEGEKPPVTCRRNEPKQTL